jgi:hypothetical protein
MDLTETIQQLIAEKQKLALAIAMLEQLQSSSTHIPFQLGGKRRGRKSMPAQEREEVSQRMKRYWAKQSKATASRNQLVGRSRPRSFMVSCAFYPARMALVQIS